ncbi:actinorhodin polyketide synthase acyl carrier protein [Longimycelium tulufanense]|uniref:Actinorhodin polyketide synthase acyl carrier protein n=1 Tax=Longimycelium tulufanense TaxID=907463 RepID=A0A8J3FWF9_9PSEU|nr:acyl carrier protein [Longimycelium tulufanense]GGM52815.1 actinorhodin polyketide synthase acyl carrier protein [Longimycelium tulufanense]
MQKLSLDDLFDMLKSCGGDVAGLATTPEVMEMPFDALGCDSLALLETAALIRRELGVVIPDDQVVEMSTPRALIDFVNGSLVD